MTNILIFCYSRATWQVALRKNQNKLNYKVINAKFLGDKIGMNPTLLSQYVQGHKKPSDKQTEKILGGIHQIGQELAEINLIYR